MKKIRQKSALVILILIAAAGILFILAELGTLRENSTQLYSEQEQQYVELQSKQLQNMYENGNKEQEIIQYIENEIPTSGSFYYFFVKNDTVIFARNSAMTKELGTLKDWESFQQELEQAPIYVITGTFSVEADNYILGKVIDREYIVDSLGIVRFQIYGVMTLLLLVLLLLAVILLHAFLLSQERKKASQLAYELKDKNLLMQQEGKDEQQITVDLQKGLKQAKETGKYRQYCLSFYLNATHAIYIDGQKGQLHPHTWEITLHLLCPKAQFVEFHELEALIEQYMERYQDKCLNEVAPFHKVNPTLENCCEEFKNKIGRIVDKEGFSLLMIEIKESPSRAYVINLLDESNR